jgi:hypothetical protein
VAEKARKISKYLMFYSIRRWSARVLHLSNIARVAEPQSTLVAEMRKGGAQGSTENLNQPLERRIRL